MKKTNKKNTDSCFRYQFSKTILLCALAVLLLCFVGIVLSAYRIMKYGVYGFSDFLKYPFLILVCVFCIILVISILIKSQYVLNEQNFIVQFGFIKSKYPTKDITSILLNTEHKKMTVYFGEDFIVLSMTDSGNDAFAKALMKLNPDVEYSFTLADNTDNIDKDEE